MRYSREEKAKMDAIVEAFRSYIDRRDDYDVICSPKAGYLRLLTGESCEQIYFPIAGAADMLRMFIDDHLLDEEERMDHFLDYARVRSLLIPRLDALGGYREEAYAIMDEILEIWKKADIR